MAKVRVHVCVNHLTPERRPVSCNCQWWISRAECEALVGEGEIVLIPHDRRNVIAVFGLERVQARRFKACQTARTISAHDIVGAYVNGRESAARRIEAYGGRA